MEDELLMADGGPIYAETNLEQLVVEPWNAASAFLFVGIVAYWLFTLREKWKSHPFLLFVLPVLSIGGIGGTLYHGFRISRWFLLMDWMPIMIICISAAIFFFNRASGKNWVGWLALGATLLTQFLVFRIASPGFGINLSYALLGAMVLSPTVWILILQNFEGAKYIFGALGAFSLALMFRVSDGWNWLPMGTHFLWHVFGAIACHLMLTYIYCFQGRDGVV